MIESNISGCCYLWSLAHFCRTKIALAGEQVAPKMSCWYLDVLSSSLLLHKKRRASWCSSLITICINIASMSAVIATLYWRHRRKSPCKLPKSSGLVSSASFKETPLYYEEAFATRLFLSGFWLLMTGWCGRYQIIFASWFVTAAMYPLSILSKIVVIYFYFSWLSLIASAGRATDPLPWNFCDLWSLPKSLVPSGPLHCVPL